MLYLYLLCGTLYYMLDFYIVSKKNGINLHHLFFGEAYLIDFCYIVSLWPFVAWSKYHPFDGDDDSY